MDKEMNDDVYRVFEKESEEWITITSAIISRGYRYEGYLWTESSGYNGDIPGVGGTFCDMLNFD